MPTEVVSAGVVDKNLKEDAPRSDDTGDGLGMLEQAVDDVVAQNVTASDVEGVTTAGPEQFGLQGDLALVRDGHLVTYRWEQDEASGDWGLKRYVDGVHAPIDQILPEGERVTPHIAETGIGVVDRVIGWVNGVFDRVEGFNNTIIPRAEDLINRGVRGVESTLKFIDAFRGATRGERFFLLFGAVESFRRRRRESQVAQQSVGVVRRLARGCKNVTEAMSSSLKAMDVIFGSQAVGAEVGTAPA